MINNIGIISPESILTSYNFFLYYYNVWYAPEVNKKNYFRYSINRTAAKVSIPFHR
jgi:hypothetical protein